MTDANETESRCDFTRSQHERCSALVSWLLDNQRPDLAAAVMSASAAIVLAAANNDQVAYHRAQAAKIDAAKMVADAFGRSEP